MKKMTMRLIPGLIAGVMTVGSASAATQVDTQSIEATVDQLITEMQQETIKQNLSVLLLKNEMRPKMMAERVPRNFMQDSMQPVMMEKIRAQIQAQQSEIMTNR